MGKQGESYLLSLTTFLFIYFFQKKLRCHVSAFDLAMVGDIRDSMSPKCCPNIITQLKSTLYSRLKLG